MMKVLASVVNSFVSIEYSTVLTSCPFEILMHGRKNNKSYGKQDIIAEKKDQNSQV